MGEPIRILCVVSTLDHGGSETMCMNVYRAINRSKVQFDFVKHTHSCGDYEDEINELGGRIFAAPRFTFRRSIIYIRWWIDFLKDHPEYKIIHGHFFTISPVYFFVAHLKKRVTIGHVHASKADRIAKKILCSWIEASSDVCLACSKAAGRWVYKKKPYIILKNAIDTQKFEFNNEIREKTRQQLGIDESVCVIGTVANLSGVKNPMGLIDIFKCIYEKNKKAKLLWVGEGYCRKQIEERIVLENIQDDVIMLGTRYDVPELLQAMDAFLLPSFNEGLPLSVIEAQAAGLMCFCSSGVPKEVDITGRCVFLPLGESDVWATRILNSELSHVNIKEKIIQAGYDIESTSNWLSEMYLALSDDTEKKEEVIARITRSGEAYGEDKS